MTPNFLWFKIDKQHVRTSKYIYVCGIYIPPYSLNYFHPEMFEDLENDTETLTSQGSVLLMGDFTYLPTYLQGRSIILGHLAHFSPFPPLQC